jgi:hypothetical protein
MLIRRVLPVFLLIWGMAASGQAETALPDVMAVPKGDWAHARVLEWLHMRNLEDPAKQAAIDVLWKSPDGASLPAESILGRVISSFAIGHEPTAAFLTQLEASQSALSVPDPRTLYNAKELGNFYDSNLRVYFARYLTQRQMYEEALETLSGAKLTETVDPAGMLFYKATCEKALGLRDEGLATLNQLLKRMEGTPPRYQNVGTLMQSDLELLEAKSLDDIANKMSDVKRRLLLARAGEKTQKVEKEIVDLLDEIIKKKEDQAKQQQQQQQQDQQQGKAGKTNKSNSALKDSQVKGSTAPGEVDKKKLKAGPAWGNMDEKERAKAKNAISRDFPPYYRQTIEEYFRKLAERDSK